ncbi:DUF3993 domain-containing protein [Pradoshia sp.]
MKHLMRMLLVSLAIVLVFPLLNVKADRQLSEEEAFRLLQEAFDTQVALNEKPRSMEAIEESLGRYFTTEYTEDFIEMNVKENIDGEGYLAYGTDFALYYIPFFTYDENTEIGYDRERDQWYVYEWFGESVDGPVSYEGHYEAVGITYEDNGWTINDYQIRFNPDDLNAEKAEENNRNREVSEKDDGIWGTMLGFIKYTSVASLASLGWIATK